MFGLDVKDLILAVQEIAHAIQEAVARQTLVEGKLAELERKVAELSKD